MTNAVDKETDKLDGKLYSLKEKYSRLLTELHSKNPTLYTNVALFTKIKRISETLVSKIDKADQLYEDKRSQFRSELCGMSNIGTTLANIKALQSKVAAYNTAVVELQQLHK